MMGVGNTLKIEIKKSFSIFFLFVFINTTSLLASTQIKWKKYAKDLRATSSKTTTNKTNTAKKNKSKYAGWHAAIKVKFKKLNTKVYQYKNSTVFGELVNSRNGKDRQDVLSVSSNAIEVVFPQYEWYDNRGDYESDYRHNRKSKENAKKVWTFQIRLKKDVNLKNVPFSISLDGIYDINISKDNSKVMYAEVRKDLEKRDLFNLVDVDNGLMYFYDELKDITFTMGGLKRRTFRWIKNGLADKKEYEKVTQYEDELKIEQISSTDKKSVNSENKKDEIAKDFIPDKPRDPNNPFGFPPSF
jgi:hypothetical protein